MLCSISRFFVAFRPSRRHFMQPKTANRASDRCKCVCEHSIYIHQKPATGGRWIFLSNTRTRTARTPSSAVHRLVLDLLLQLQRQLRLLLPPNGVIYTPAKPNPRHLCAHREVHSIARPGARHDNEDDEDDHTEPDTLVRGLAPAPASSSQLQPALSIPGIHQGRQHWDWRCIHRSFYSSFLCRSITSHVHTHTHRVREWNGTEGTSAEFENTSLIGWRASEPSERVKGTERANLRARDTDRTDREQTEQTERVQPNTNPDDDRRQPRSQPASQRERCALIRFLESNSSFEQEQGRQRKLFLRGFFFLVFFFYAPSSRRPGCQLYSLSLSLTLPHRANN